MRHETNSVWYGPSDTCKMASLQSVIGMTHPSDQDPSWEGSPHKKLEKNKCVLKWSIGKIQCFEPMFFVENQVLTTPSPP